MVMPYGYVNPTGKVPLHTSEDQLKKLMSVQKVNYAAGKTKMAAWIVSSCFSHSSRHEMVKILQKYIQVDAYGDCGTLECPKEVEFLWEKRENGTNGREEDVRKKRGPTFLFSPIRPILPLLPVLPSKNVNNAFNSFLTNKWEFKK
jgi:alpha-1,3-fucosyltransferase